MLNLSPASIPATHARIVHSAMGNDDYLISAPSRFTTRSGRTPFGR
jgi:hypothetical protein